MAGIVSSFLTGWGEPPGDEVPTVEATAAAPPAAPIAVGLVLSDSSGGRQPVRARGWPRRNVGVRRLRDRRVPGRELHPGVRPPRASLARVRGPAVRVPPGRPSRNAVLRTDRAPLSTPVSPDREDVGRGFILRVSLLIRPAVSLVAA